MSGRGGAAVATPPLALRLGRTAGRIGDARFLDRLVRGRAWIALIAVGLLGIVFVQVSMLRLNAGISRAIATAETLQRQNSALRGDISRLDSGERIADTARALGMAMPPAGSVHYLDARKADAGAAARAIRPPNAMSVAGGPTASLENQTGQSGTATSQWGSAGTQSAAPIGQSGSPTAQSGPQTAQSASATGPSGSPTAQSASPTAQSGSPTAQAGSPTGQSGSPTAQSASPTAQSGSRTTPSVSPTAQSASPTAQSASPTATSASSPAAAATTGTGAAAAATAGPAASGGRGTSGQGG
jgi:hypothetical protein